MYQGERTGVTAATDQLGVARWAMQRRSTDDAYARVERMTLAEPAVHGVLRSGHASEQGLGVDGVHR